MRAEDVAHYLQGNPKFFEDYADLMAHVVIPHPHSGRAISITERQMISLRDRNREMEAKLAELIQFGEENDAISERMHRLAVGLAAATTLSSVLHALQYHLREDFLVPQVALRLWQAPASELPAYVAVAPTLQALADTLTKPYCGSTSGFDASGWFGADAARLRSQSLIALRGEGGSFGLLALGAEDARRFYPEMGTLYLERLGELASAALLRTLLVRD